MEASAARNHKVLESRQSFYKFQAFEIQCVVWFSSIFASIYCTVTFEEGVEASGCSVDKLSAKWGKLIDTNEAMIACFVIIRFLRSRLEKHHFNLDFVICSVSRIVENPLESFHGVDYTDCEPSNPNWMITICLFYYGKIVPLNYDNKHSSEIRIQKSN